MKIRSYTCICALLTTLFFSQAVSAQEPLPRPDMAPTALAAGAHSLSFAIPNGGNPYAPGTIGYWMMFTPQLNLGLNLGFALDRQESGNDTVTSWDVLLAPAIKYYTTRAYAVAPYYFGQLNIRLHDDGVDATDDDAEVSAALGIGAEWFPVQRFSVSGHTGLGIDIIRSGNGEPIAIGTFTSGLVATIYF